MSDNVVYDIRFWEEIRSVAKYKLDELVRDVRAEIARDLSLAEFRGKQAIPWQLREVMKQRADSWVARVYEICCEARKEKTKAPSLDFDRAVWAYCIQPFIVGEKHELSERYSMSPLLDLLFMAVGVPYDKRDSLTASHKDTCLSVRGSICDFWYSRLNHTPSRLDEAVAAMSRYHALERHAQRKAAGLPPEPDSKPILLSTPAQTPASSKSPIVTVATWDALEISFLSDERVQICNGAKTETRNYAEFGFKDRRSEKPNGAWAILLELAKKGGVIRNSGNTGRTWPIIEKQVQNARSILRAHFGITMTPSHSSGKLATRHASRLAVAARSIAKRIFVEASCIFPKLLFSALSMT